MNNSFVDFLGHFPKKDWIEFIENDFDFNSIAAKDKKDYINEIIYLLEASLDKGKTGKSMDLLYLGVKIGRHDFIGKLKRQGFLRHSHYLIRKNPLFDLATNILKHSVRLGLEEKDISFFESIKNATSIYYHLKELNIRINKTLLYWKNRRDKLNSIPFSFVKTLLSYNEFIFMSRNSNRDGLSFDNLLFFTKEDISEGISILVYMWYESNIYDKSYLGICDSDYIESRKIEKVVLDMCQFEFLIQLEIKIEEFGFIATKNQNNVIINHPSDEFNKSIELGFISAKLQHDANTVNYQEQIQDIPSYRDLCKDIHDLCPDLIVFKESPYGRYSITFSEGYISEIIAKDAFFKDDLIYLNTIAGEILYDSIDELKETIIEDYLSIYQFIRLNRFFSFLYYLFYEKIHESVGREINSGFLHSIPLVLSKLELISFLKLIEPEEAVKKYIDILSWDSASKTFLDLQYSPIVINDDFCFISGSLLSGSNLVRNMIVNLAKRNNVIQGRNSNQSEKIGIMLSEAFSSQGFVCNTDLKVKYKSEQQDNGDIDFLAYKDGCLFVAECKHNIYPTNVFELRTVFQNLKKANNQLDYVKKALNDEQFRIRLGQRLKLNLKDISKIHTCVVTSNKIMWGSNFFNHPIRNIREITSYIRTGILYTNMRQLKSEEAFCLWNDNSFELSDLDSYLDVDNSYIRLFYNSMEPTEFIIYDDLLVKTYGFDVERFKSDFQVSFSDRVIEKSTNE